MKCHFAAIHNILWSICVTCSLRSMACKHVNAELMSSSPSQ